MPTRRLLLALVLVALTVGGTTASASVVRFSTVMGNIDVELFDQAKPLTVANFRAYQSAGDWSNTMINRSEPGFVIQGGGYRFNNTAQVFPQNYPQVVQRPPVLNEPGLSNVRGTIAMAKIGGMPNSATSQWFFNLVNNGGPGQTLDTLESGYTVFGRVIGNGMTVVDAIAALPRFEFQAPPGPWSVAPMRNYTAEEFFDFVPVDGTNVVLINTITVIPDVDADLVLDDGDGDGNPGDTRCTSGMSVGCDDNCPTVSNATQTDSGGFRTTVPDGNGNACQCGEVSGDGGTNVLDLVLMARFVVLSQALPNPARCPASLGALCDGANIARLRRGLAGLLTPGPYGCLVGL